MANRDDRLIQGARNVSEERVNRVDEDRPETEDRTKTDKLRLAERLAMLESVDTVLPTPPILPGFHTCWLTTTNPNDSLERRFQLGYELVKPEEIRGRMAFATQKSGESTSADRVTINEMVLAKLPEELYLAYLKHSHHTRPLEQENAINGSNVISQMKDGRGKAIGIVEGEGHNDLGRPRAPRFDGVMDRA